MNLFAVRKLNTFILSFITLFSFLILANKASAQETFPNYIPVSDAIHDPYLVDYLKGEYNSSGNNAGAIEWYDSGFAQDAVSFDGDHAVVADAYSHSNPEIEDDSFRIRFFDKINNAWEQQEVFELQLNQVKGIKLRGNYAVVGTGSTSYVNRIYLFERNETTGEWAQTTINGSSYITTGSSYPIREVDMTDKYAAILTPGRLYIIDIASKTYKQITIYSDQFTPQNQEGELTGQEAPGGGVSEVRKVDIEGDSFYVLTSGSAMPNSDYQWHVIEYRREGTDWTTAQINRQVRNQLTIVYNVSTDYEKFPDDFAISGNYMVVSNDLGFNTYKKTLTEITLSGGELRRYYKWEKLNNDVDISAIPNSALPTFGKVLGFDGDYVATTTYVTVDGQEKERLLIYKLQSDETWTLMNGPSGAAPLIYGGYDWGYSTERYGGDEITTLDQHGSTVMLSGYDGIAYFYGNTDGTETAEFPSSSLSDITGSSAASTKSIFKVDGDTVVFDSNVDGNADPVAIHFYDRSGATWTENASFDYANLISQNTQSLITDINNTGAYVSNLNLDTGRYSTFDIQGDKAIVSVPVSMNYDPDGQFIFGYEPECVQACVDTYPHLSQQECTDICATDGGAWCVVGCIRDFTNDFSVLFYFEKDNGTWTLKKAHNPLRRVDSVALNSTKLVTAGNEWIITPLPGDPPYSLTYSHEESFAIKVYDLNALSSTGNFIKSDPVNLTKDLPPLFISGRHASTYINENDQIVAITGPVYLDNQGNPGDQFDYKHYYITLFNNEGSSWEVAYEEDIRWAQEFGFLSSDAHAFLSSDFQGDKYAFIGRYHWIDLFNILDFSDAIGMTSKIPFTTHTDYNKLVHFRPRYGNYYEPVPGGRGGISLDGNLLAIADDENIVSGHRQSVYLYYYDSTADRYRIVAKIHLGAFEVANGKVDVVLDGDDLYIANSSGDFKYFQLPTDITSNVLSYVDAPCTDKDGDGYAIEGGSCGPIDCDDLSSDINPAATDDPCDGIDNDCDAGTQEHDDDWDGHFTRRAECYSEVDVLNDNGDGTYGPSFTPDTPVADCNDRSLIYYPGAPDATCNNVDENCVNGRDDEFFVTYGQDFYCGSDECYNQNGLYEIDYVAGCNITQDTCFNSGTATCSNGVISGNCTETGTAELRGTDADSDDYGAVGTGLMSCLTTLDPILAATDCDDSDPLVQAPTGFPGWGTPDANMCIWSGAIEEGSVEIHHYIGTYTGTNAYTRYTAGVTNGEDSVANDFDDLNFKRDPTDPNYTSSDALTSYVNLEYGMQFTFVNGSPQKAEIPLDVDTTATNQVLNSGGTYLTGDENSEVIPLGFQTKIYGKIVDSVVVNANGLVFLNNTQDMEIPEENATIPSSSWYDVLSTSNRIPTVNPYQSGLDNYLPTDNVVIAGKWLNYLPYSNRVKYISKDSGTDRGNVFIVWFDNVRMYNTSSSTYQQAFQIKIYERQINNCIDNDGDGYYASSVDCPQATVLDCDDNDPNATALQAGPWYLDGDGDGYGIGSDVGDLCLTSGYSQSDGDCNDTDGTIHPNAVEQCDGIDSNCSGGPEVDADGDGHYGSDPDGVCGLLDCNDSDNAIYPGATEACDGIDSDCGGETEVDADGDGWSPAGQGGGICIEIDCNDSDANVQGPSNVPQWVIDAGYDACANASSAADGRVEIHQIDTSSNYLYTTMSKGISNGDDANYANFDDLNFEGTPTMSETPGAEAYYFENGNAIKRNILLNRETLSNPTNIGFETNWNSGAIPLGFETKLYGKPVDTIYMSSNGVVYLNDSSNLQGDPGITGSTLGMNTTSTSLPVNPYSPTGDIMVAGNYHQLYGGTLDTTVNYDDATISYGLQGTAPNRVFIIDYDNVYARRYYYSYYSRYYYYYPTSFQIKIYENGGTIPEPTVPDPPTLNSIPTSYNGNANLNWDPPVFDGNVDFISPITNYKIRYGEQGNGCGDNTPFNPSDTTCNYLDVGDTTGHTIAGLINDTTYEFVVFAENRIGLSLPSNPQTTTPLAASEGAIEIHLGSDLNADYTEFTGTLRDRYYASGISNGNDLVNLDDLDFKNATPTQDHIVGAERYEFSGGNPQSSDIPLNIEDLNNPNIVELDDDTFTTSIIPLGFNTLIYGKEIDSMIIGSNGFIYVNSNEDLDASGGYQGYTTSPMEFIGMPGMDYNSSSDAPPNNILIAGVMSDLDPGDCSYYNYSLNRCNGGYSPHGTIKYKTIGQAPNRVMIVHFDGIMYYSGYYNDNERVNFQIKIFESQNTTCTDNDGDSYYAEGGICGPQDCNDNNAAVNPNTTGNTPCSIYNNTFVPTIIPVMSFVPSGTISQLGLHEVDIQGDIAVGTDEDGELTLFQQNTSGDWEEYITITLPDSAIGRHVLINGDYIIVSDNEYGDSSSGSQGQGSVWMYKLDRTANTLTLVDQFTMQSWYYLIGSSLAANEDYIILSIPGALSLQGQVIVLKKDENADTWAQITTLQASDGQSNATYFGEHALDMNEEWIAVGSNGASFEGGVYLFQKQSGADTWPTQIKLFPADMGANSYFGTHEVKLAGDYLFVSHEKAWINGEGNAGEIVIFLHDGSGNWNEIQRISQFDAEANREFGKHFDVNSDRLIVPFTFTDGNGNERFNIDVFEINSNGSGVTFEERLTPDPAQMICWENGLQTPLCSSYNSLNAAISDEYIIAGTPTDAHHIQDSGALWFYGFTTVQQPLVGGGGSEEPICSAHPVQIDLKDELDVYIVNGKPEVEINWGKISGGDSNYSKKVRTFFDYLKTDPTIGNTSYKLKNLFARYMLNEMQLGSIEFKTLFKEALGDTIQEDINLLEDRNIRTLFTDWWPYLFINELKTNKALAGAFMEGVRNGLNEGGDVIYLDFLRSIINELKNADSGGDFTRIAICMQGETDNIKLEDYIPRKNQNIYASRDDDLERLLEDIKDAGDMVDLFAAIKKDKTLVKNTLSSLDVGINSLLFTWQNNGNISRLIKLYETDPSVRAFLSEFTETSLFKDLENCIKSHFKSELLEKTKETYVPMVLAELEQNNICSDDQAEVVFSATQKMMTSDQKESVGRVILSFTNDYLILENLVDRETNRGTPFDDYYSAHLEGILSNYVDGMTINIYRNGSLVHSESNPQITKYTDANIPINNTGRVKYYQYYIETATECSTKEGKAGKAKINPMLDAGTPVSASANVKIHIKDSYSHHFMDKLRKLLSQEVEGSQPKSDTSQFIDSEIAFTSITSGKNNSKECLEASQALYIRRNSDNALHYVKTCWGNEGINPKIDQYERDIIPPFLKLIMIEGKENMHQVAEKFLPPIIKKLQAELEREISTISNAAQLRTFSDDLYQISSIDDLTEEQKQRVICGGELTCSEERKAEIESYFEGASHAANIYVEVYSPEGGQLYKVPTRTNLFGEVKGVQLGILDSGVPYTFKIRLADEPYALPKIRVITINNAEPIGNGRYIATVDLIHPLQYRYGNFMNDDDEITLEDIIKWGELLSEEPEKWQDANVDGFTGINLLDATTIQGNWGVEAEISLEGEQITYQELVTIFGYRGGSDKIISIPGWIQLEDNACMIK